MAEADSILCYVQYIPRIVCALTLYIIMFCFDFTHIPQGCFIGTGPIMTQCQWSNPGGGTHYMKVTTYAPPFRPPFFRSLENLYSFDPYILAKMRKMSYFDPYFSSKLGKMYSFDPPSFFTLVAFRVNGRCWASLSETELSTPPPPPPPREATLDDKSKLNPEEYK